MAYREHMTVVADVVRPDGVARGVVVLAHGAGGNRDAAILRGGSDALRSSRAIVAALRRGSTATVTGVSARGTTTVDTFSLSGFTAAVGDAEKRCG